MPLGAVPVLSRCCQRSLRVRKSLQRAASSPRDGYVEAPACLGTLAQPCDSSVSCTPKKFVLVLPRWRHEVMGGRVLELMVDVIVDGFATQQ